MKELLETRNKLKAKKPTFIRHDAHKKLRVGTGWRKPTGRQNKMRLHRKGYARSRSTGFGSPIAVKGLSRNGLVQVIIHNKKDFEGLNPSKDGIIFSRTLGARKKTELIAHAQEKKFTILSLDANKYTQRVKEQLAAKESKKKELLKKKSDQKKAAEKTDKKQEDKKAVAQDNSEDKKEVEKKEHDKVLTKKDNLGN